MFCSFVIRFRQRTETLKLWLGICCLGVSLGAGVHAAAQAPAPRASRPGGPVARSGSQTPDKTPCWQKAGVSPDVFTKVTAIRDDTRNQVNSACADSSLPREQKLQKVLDLRKAAHEQIDALIPKTQQDAIRSCQKTRTRRPPRHRGRHRTLDPCGEPEPSTLASPGSPDNDDPASRTPDPKAPDTTVPDGASPKKDNPQKDNQGPAVQPPETSPKPDPNKDPNSPQRESGASKNRALSVQ
jgi:hypothetical protein